MPIKILHWINLTRLYRCHLTFENNDEFTHYYVTDKARHNLKEKPNIFTGNPRSMAFLGSVCDQVKPDVIICGNLINANLMKFMKERCRLFIYISHTIWTDKTIQNKITNQAREKPAQSYGIFDKLYFLPKEIEMWKKLQMPEEKLETVHGLTYMDPLLMFDHEKIKNKIMNKFCKGKNVSSTMLLLHNSTLTGCFFPNGRAKNQKVNSDDYGIMLQEMVKYAEKHNSHIFARIGRRSNTLTETNLVKKLHSSPYVTVIRPEADYLLYDFLFCDVIINQNYSTAYLESLIVNHSATCCYLNGKEMIDAEEYPDLAIIREVNEIQPMIDRMINHREEFYTQQITEQIDRLLVNSFGSKLENVTERVLSDIAEWSRNN